MVCRATTKSKFCDTVEDVPLVPPTETSSTRFIAACAGADNVEKFQEIVDKLRKS